MVVPFIKMERARTRIGLEGSEVEHTKFEMTVTCPFLDVK